MKRFLYNFLQSKINECKEFYGSKNEYLLIDPLSIFSTAAGIGQMFAGLIKGSNNKRPVMPSMTKATEEAVRRSRQMANTTTDPILSNQMENISQDAANSTSAVKRAFSDPGQILSSVSKLTSATNRARRGASADFGIRKMNREQNFLGQLAQAAMEERQAFAYNKAQKYQENANAASGLIGAGLTNLGNTFSEQALAKNNRALAEYVYGNPSSESTLSDNVNFPADLSKLHSLIAGDRSRLDRGLMG